MAAEHTCKPYRNARGERVDPAQQNGIGCPVCNPPGARISKMKEDTNAG